MNKKLRSQRKIAVVVAITMEMPVAVIKTANPVIVPKMANPVAVVRPLAAVVRQMRITKQVAVVEITIN